MHPAAVSYTHLDVYKRQALCEFFAWFEGALGNERITELTIDEQITAARARRPEYVCPSFATIAGFNALSLIHI